MRAMPYNSGVREIRKHLHSAEFVFGKAITPVGETHVVDHISQGTAGAPILPFRVDGGNDFWGDWVQIMGSADGGGGGTVAFDPHRALIVDAERTSSTYFIQVCHGLTTTTAAMLAMDYTESIWRALASGNTEIPLVVQSKPIPVGHKVWVRVWAVGQNTGTMDFFWLAHGYLPSELG
jgi:hypothetical protein